MSKIQNFFNVKYAETSIVFTGLLLKNCETPIYHSLHFAQYFFFVEKL